MTILLVEDDQATREAVVDSLADEGYSVVAVQDGAEATKYLSNVPRLPSLILLSLGVPAFDGWTFKQTLDVTPAWENIPVIVYTTDPGQAPARVIAVIEKPLTLMELMSLINSELIRLGMKP